MSTVQDFIECDICSHLAYTLFDCRRQTIRIHCWYCGYSYRDYFLIDRKHEKKTGEQYYKVTKNGKWIHRFRKRIGYGAYHFTKVSGAGCSGSFPKPITQSNIDNFKKYLKEEPHLVPEKCYLISFDPATKELTPLIGKIPRHPFGDEFAEDDQ